MLAFAAPSTLLAQESVKPIEAVEPVEQAPLTLKDPLEFEDPEGWDYIKPVGWILFTNGMFWGVARVFLDKPYSYIGPSSIARNFRQGWEWDADAFPTNQFGHPYQGGLYHAGARATGFNFWESIPYTILGSLQWEMFMETELPSVNDLITTSVGGVIVGEALFRLAALLIDESSEDSERVIREAGTLAISPIFGFDRLLTGDATRSGLPPVRPPAALRLSLGFDRFRPVDAKEGVRNIGSSLRVVYGEFEDDGRPFRPFDWFMLGGAMHYRHPKLEAASLEVIGLLARTGFGCGEGNDCVVGPSMRFDYERTPVFMVGTSTVGGTAIGRFDLGFWSLQLYAQLDLQVIALGGFDSPYAEVVERDYNLGAGGFSRGTVMLTKPDLFQLRLFANRYYVRTIHGAKGNEFAGLFRTELEFPIYSGFGLAVGNVIYDRIGMPQDYPKVQTSHISQQLQIFWRSGFGALL